MDTIDNIDLRTLRVMDAVARHKSFTEAGRELGIPRALVSKMVAELERTLGSKLFRRTTRKVGLTPAGSALLNLCNQPLVTLRDALLSTQYRTSETAGTIRFSVSHAYGRRFILPVLSRFQKDNSRIRIECILNDALDDLVVKSLDFSIRMGPLPLRDKSIRTLETLDIVLAAPAEIARRAKSLKKIEDIKKYPTIGFRLPANGAIMPWVVYKSGQTKTVDVSQSALTVNSIEAAADLVVAGAGIAPVPRYLIEKQLARGEVEALFNSYRFQSITSYIVMPDMEGVTTRVKLLVDTIEKSRR
jgi:LysR family transcriptional regulator, regulator for bpeEF and oprC